MVGRRNLYPKPYALSYVDLGMTSPLTAAERGAHIRSWVESQEDLAQAESMKYLRKLLAEAEEYGDLAAEVDANGIRRLRSKRGSSRDEGSFVYTNFVMPSDPRRWCDECTGYRRHRQRCEMILVDGLYVGGYESDGLQPTQRKFAQLKQPKAHWDQRTRNMHARAVRRRWDAFVATWTSIGLDVFTRAVTMMSPVAIQINDRKVGCR